MRINLKTIVLGVGFVAALFLLVATQTSHLASAAQVDMEARIAKMSTSSVGVYVATEIAREVRSCASRVVTTNNNIYLSFDPNFAPTGTQAGHYQAASTTVTYESDLFGCGAIKAIAPATTTITMTEFRF